MGGGAALGTWGRTRGDRGGQDLEDPELPSSTVQALPIRVGPANPDGQRTYQYWPFSTSDLYNWKTQNPPFSEKPQVYRQTLMAGLRAAARKPTNLTKVNLVR